MRGAGRDVWVKIRASEADARRSVSCCEYSSYEIDWLDSRHLIPADWISRELCGGFPEPS